MPAWSHSPNAQLIDQVLTDLVTYHTQFVAAGSGLNGTNQWNESWDTARNVVGDEAWHEVYHAAMRAALWIGASNVAAGAMLALIAYDDAEQYLSMPLEKLKFWAALSHVPAAILLQPYMGARERVAQMQQIQCA